jgi:hypothetical protein
MNAISLWQPWASLWCSPRKIHETRHWPTAYHGWLAVHAAKRFEKDFDGPFANLLRAEFGTNWFRDLPRGALIGIVNVIACIPTATIAPSKSDDWLCGDFTEGRFAWQRGEFKLLSAPIPYVGRLGFFQIDSATSSQLMALASSSTKETS